MGTTSTLEAVSSPVPRPITPELAACSHPHARLTHPYWDAKLRGTVEIRGTADLDGFWYYKFEFRASGTEEWAFIERFETPVTNGTLGYWDATGLPDGQYEFRLLVVDKSGNYPPPCDLRIRVQH